MCGICGLVSFERPVNKDTLERMTAAISHRGPDAAGFYFDNNGVSAAFGHRRLKIIDLSDAAAQPIANESQSLRLVFNGEIYNYIELRDELIAKGHLFRSASDSEVILHLFEESGVDCLNRLDGMFSFAIWNADKKELFMARDRLGKKPLFYYAGQKSFAFASEIKSLLAGGQVPYAVNEEKITAYFTYGYVPCPDTIYKGIFQLAPGHWLCMKADGSISRRQYWDVAFSRQDGPHQAAKLGKQQSIAELRRLMFDSVKKRLVSDVPLGAFLSGGVDSSIIVGIMSKIMPVPVKTFTVGYAKGSNFNETGFARIVADHFHTEHTELRLEPCSLDMIDKLVWFHDGPFGDSSALPSYLISQAARKHVTVALIGDGGDELFAGYQRFAAALMAQRMPRAFVNMAGWAFNSVPEPKNYHSPVRKAQRFFAAAKLPVEEKVAKWVSIFYEDIPLLCPGAGRYDPDGYFAPYLKKTEGYTGLSRLLYLNLKTYLLDDLLVKMDRATMANGFEVRSPFLDRGLLEFVSMLPDEMKLRGLRTKVLLREAFSDMLPAVILKRKKMGFGIPLGLWLREGQDFVRDKLLSPSALLKRYLDQGYIKNIVDQHDRGYRDNGHKIWSLLTFESWLSMSRRFQGDK